MSSTMNPDCRDGKHQACAGDGWDEAAEAPAPCPCECHGLTSDSNTRWHYGINFAILDETHEFRREVLKKWLDDTTDKDLTHFEWSADKEPPPKGLGAGEFKTLHLGMWDQDPRQKALAAKAARGKGPPSPGSWRGRARTMKFRSQ